LAAHKYLCEKLKILHCDVSIGNILIYRSDDDQEATGLLIDFDFATTILTLHIDIIQANSGSQVASPDNGNPNCSEAIGKSSDDHADDDDAFDDHADDDDAFDDHADGDNASNDDSESGIFDGDLSDAMPISDIGSDVGVTSKQEDEPMNRIWTVSHLMVHTGLMIYQSSNIPRELPPSLR
jgi:hypothetical protein